MPPTTTFKDHANTYADWSVINPFNRDYDRPTILHLAGALNGKRVLELGCASGVLTAHLVERGADVLSVDVEPQMIELARQNSVAKPGSRSSISTSHPTSVQPAVSTSS